MHFELTIQPQAKQNFIPINYQYEISGWIYKTIHFGDPEIFFKRDLSACTAPESVGYIIDWREREGGGGILIWPIGK